MWHSLDGVHSASLTSFRMKSRLPNYAWLRPQLIRYACQIHFWKQSSRKSIQKIAIYFPKGCFVVTYVYRSIFVWIRITLKIVPPYKCNVCIPFMLKAIFWNLSAFLCWHDLTDHQCKQNLLKGSNFMLTDFKSKDLGS